MNYKVFVAITVYGLCSAILILLVMSLSLYITENLVLGTILINCIVILATIFGFIARNDHEN